MADTYAAKPYSLKGSKEKSRTKKKDFVIPWRIIVIVDESSLHIRSL